MCKKIFKFFVYSTLIVLSISAISIVFLLPKDDFKECECEELDTSLTDFFESKFETELIHTLKGSTRAINAGENNGVIIFQDSISKFSLYQAYTAQTDSYFSIQGMGIVDEYSFVKYNKEISYTDILSFDFHLGYFMTKLIMIALKTVAYSYHSNTFYFESTGAKFLTSTNQDKKGILTFAATIYFKSGVQKEIQLFNPTQNISLNEFKKIVCSQLDIQNPIANQQYLKQKLQED